METRSLVAETPDEEELEEEEEEEGVYDWDFSPEAISLQYTFYASYKCNLYKRYIFVFHIFFSLEPKLLGCGYTFLFILHIITFFKSNVLLVSY